MITTKTIMITTIMTTTIKTTTTIITTTASVASMVYSSSAHPPGGGGGGDSQWSVTSVLFQGDNHLISSGAKDGTIKVWDLRQLYQTSGFVLRGRVDPTPAHVLSYAGEGVGGWMGRVLEIEGRWGAGGVCVIGWIEER